MNWWENEIDGFSLEWQNHESDNRLLFQADLSSLPDRIMGRFGGTVLGISKNPPAGESLSRFDVETWAVCFEADGDIHWFHVLKGQFELWLEGVSEGGRHDKS